MINKFIFVMRVEVQGLQSNQISQWGSPQRRHLQELKCEHCLPMQDMAAWSQASGSLSPCAARKCRGSWRRRRARDLRGRGSPGGVGSPLGGAQAQAQGALERRCTLMKTQMMVPWEWEWEVGWPLQLPSFATLALPYRAPQCFPYKKGTCTPYLVSFLPHNWNYMKEPETKRNEDAVSYIFTIRLIWNEHSNFEDSTLCFLPTLQII